METHEQALPEELQAADEAVDGLGTTRGQVTAARLPVKSPHIENALKALKAAKLESDRRNYGAKHELLRQAIMANSSDFLVDSQQGNIVGLTHIPTNFRIHAPAKVLPPIPRQLLK